MVQIVTIPEVSKDDFIQWRQHPVTAHLFFTLRKEIREHEEFLGKHAGMNPPEDRRRCGYILACNEILEFKPEEYQE